jgi:RNA polymerase sigma-70 factor (ECF subfamily)
LSRERTVRAVPEARSLPLAFDAVYREHFAMVWRTLRRFGVPERDLPDAAQDVFVVVHRRLAEFDGRSRISTWLYAICLRVASVRRRSAASRWEAIGEEPDAARASGASSEPWELVERRALLAEALDAMALEQRTVFVLFELEGMTGDEIAEVVAAPLATVHSRLRLARETFRRVVDRARSREAFDFARMGESL